MLRALQLPDGILSCTDKDHGVSVSLLAKDDFSDYLNL